MQGYATYWCRRPWHTQFFLVPAVRINLAALGLGLGKLAMEVASIVYVDDASSRDHTVQIKWDGMGNPRLFLPNSLQCKSAAAEGSPIESMHRIPSPYLDLRGAAFRLFCVSFILNGTRNGCGHGRGRVMLKHGATAHDVFLFLSFPPLFRMFRIPSVLYSSFVFISKEDAFAGYEPRRKERNLLAQHPAPSTQRPCHARRACPPLLSFTPTLIKACIRIVYR